MIALTGTEYPIIQAPMAGVSTPALAAAVSNAGGLGSLGIGASSLAQARAMILQARSLTNRPINVNVFCHAPARRNEVVETAWIRHLSPLFAELGAQVPGQLNEIYQSFLTDEEAFHMLLEVKPAVVSFHFGIPAADKITAFKAAGMTTLATATNLEEALAIQNAGIDGIIAQGIEAGGHRGMFDPAETDERLGTLDLLRQLVRHINRPIIAAGGIMDGGGVMAALDLGAVAVQLGTAFILCPETAADTAYRHTLKTARSGQTRLTSVISGRPARGIVNRLIEHGEASISPPPADYPVAYDLAKQLHEEATKIGNSGFAAHWAGQGAPFARELPAAQLMQVLVDELTAARCEH
ncbi:nitronate monooxygenase [Rhizobiales bacterium RZME27]|uniref:Nitronate monooxygenase n=1 Tax=Endobacterium cereale TaxID=2663029 RepID=A0A6A8A3M7_9HYPH|nr:nitronate monooxygenase [Endobacterium cereale]MEB2844518.1 nitronate monooxygenase [Endobacterium cereale]MQY45164.1 nitronate monooxygenase [Endobacterium cereale]